MNTDNNLAGWRSASLPLYNHEIEQQRYKDISRKRVRRAHSKIGRLNPATPGLEPGEPIS
jgi:hypothetical protein